MWWRCAHNEITDEPTSADLFVMDGDKHKGLAMVQMGTMMGDVGGETFTPVLESFT